MILYWLFQPSHLTLHIASPPNVHTTKQICVCLSRLWRKLLFLTNVQNKCSQQKLGKQVWCCRWLSFMMNDLLVSLKSCACSCSNQCVCIDVCIFSLHKVTNLNCWNQHSVKYAWGDVTVKTSRSPKFIPNSIQCFHSGKVTAFSALVEL